MKSFILWGTALLLTGAAQAQETPTSPAATATATATSAVASTGADDTISADRPGFSTGTSIVPRGSIQLEAGSGVSRSGDSREHTFGELLVRVPVSDKAEVRVGVPSYLSDHGGGAHAKGFDDLFLETKISLGTCPLGDYALLLNSVVPTGSRSVAEHKFQPGANLAANLNLPHNVGLTLNLGAARASNGGDRFTQVSGAACFNFTLTPKTGTFAEVYAYNQDGGPTQKYADGGFTYLLTPKFQLDTSAGVGLGNRAGGPDYFLDAGIARLF